MGKSKSITEIIDDFVAGVKRYVFASFADCQALPGDRLARGAENYVRLDSFDLNYQLPRGTTSEILSCRRVKRE